MVGSNRSESSTTRQESQEGGERDKCWGSNWGLGLGYLVGFG